MLNAVLPLGNIQLSESQQSEGCTTARRPKAVCFLVSLDEHWPCAASLITLSGTYVNRPVVKVPALRRSVTVKGSSAFLEDPISSRG